MEGKEIGY